MASDKRDTIEGVQERKRVGRRRGYRRTASRRMCPGPCAGSQPPPLYRTGDRSNTYGEALKPSPTARRSKRSIGLPPGTAISAGAMEPYRSSSSALSPTAMLLSFSRSQWARTAHPAGCAGSARRCATIMRRCSHATSHDASLQIALSRCGENSESACNPSLRCTVTGSNSRRCRKRSAHKLIHLLFSTSRHMPATPIKLAWATIGGNSTSKGDLRRRVGTTAQNASICPNSARSAS